MKVWLTQGSLNIFFGFFFRSKVRDTKVLIEDTDDDTWPLRPQWLDKVFFKDHRPQWASTLQKLSNQSITKLPDHTHKHTYTTSHNISLTRTCIWAHNRSGHFLVTVLFFNSFVAALIIFVKIQYVDLQVNSKDSVSVHKPLDWTAFIQIKHLIVDTSLQVWSVNRFGYFVSRL